MSLESASARREKRIVEQVISGFENADLAIVFGITIKKIIKDQIGEIKFNQYIGSDETSGLAITENYNGKTVLKIQFLEVNGHNKAVYIMEEVNRVMGIYNDEYESKISLVNSYMREKPQPQFLTR